MPPLIDQWLAPFGLDPSLQASVAEVVSALPIEVRRDLMEDPGFVFYDYEPGKTMNVPMRLESGQPGRTVVLKRTLLNRPKPFVRWLIAHELAHAFLRHGLQSGTNDEAAADQLAAQWGFPRPQTPER